MNFLTITSVLLAILDWICFKWAINGVFAGLSSVCCPKKWEHIAGDKVKAQIAEIAIETAIHTANCLYITPVIPPINPIGTNTAINTKAIATSEGPTSSIVNWVAIIADLPSSKWRFTFSITTIASSTTTPTAKTKANNDNKLIDIPNACKAKNVPTNETGIVAQGTRVAIPSPKNKKMIRTTINAVSRIVNSTSCIDSLI